METLAEIHAQLDQSVVERNWVRAVLLSRELLFGSQGMTSPNSPIAIDALSAAYCGGYRPAGYELARIPFEVVGGLTPLSESEWLALMVENARRGDTGAILDVEHLPERLMSREEAELVAKQGRDAASNIVNLR